MTGKIYPWYIRIFFYLQKMKYGRVLAPNYYWGRIPRLFFAMAHFYNGIGSKRSRLRPSLRSLVMVRVSQMNDCSFCIDLNSSIYADLGSDIEKLRELLRWEESSVFDEKERVALEYAEAMTDSAIGVSAEMRVRVGQFFDEEAVIELTGLVAFQNLSSKFNQALGVESQGFCELPGLEVEA